MSADRCERAAESPPDSGAIGGIRLLEGGALDAEGVAQAFGRVIPDVVKRVNLRKANSRKQRQLSASLALVQNRMRESAVLEVKGSGDFWLGEVLREDGNERQPGKDFDDFDGALGTNRLFRDGKDGVFFDVQFSTAGVTVAVYQDARRVKRLNVELRVRSVGPMSIPDALLATKEIYERVQTEQELMEVFAGQAAYFQARFRSLRDAATRAASAFFAPWWGKAATLAVLGSVAYVAIRVPLQNVGRHFSAQTDITISQGGVAAPGMRTAETLHIDYEYGDEPVFSREIALAGTTDSGFPAFIERLSFPRNGHLDEYVSVNCQREKTLATRGSELAVQPGQAGRGVRVLLAIDTGKRSAVGRRFVGHWYRKVGGTMQSMAKDFAPMLSVSGLIKARFLYAEFPWDGSGDATAHVYEIVAVDKNGITSHRADKLCTAVTRPGADGLSVDYLRSLP